MGELKVVYKLPEFGLFGLAGHRLKKEKDWHFQTASIPKHTGTASLVWNWNKAFLVKICISGPVYSLAGINGHVPSGSVAVSSLTQGVKSRLGQNLIAEFSSKKLRNHFQQGYWSLVLWSLGTDQEIQVMYQTTTGLSFYSGKTKASIHRTIKSFPELLQIILTTTLLKILQTKFYILVLVLEDELNHQFYTQAELTVSNTSQDDNCKNQQREGAL